LGSSEFLAAHLLRFADRNADLSLRPLSNKLFTVATDLFFYSSPRGVDKPRGHEARENKAVNLAQTLFPTGVARVITSC
jgi:hypothetical protein